MSGILGYGEPADWGSDGILPQTSAAVTGNSEWGSWLDDTRGIVTGGLRDWVNLSLSQQAGKNIQKTSGYTEGQRSGLVPADLSRWLPLAALAAGVVLVLALVKS